MPLPSDRSSRNTETAAFATRFGLEQHLNPDLLACLRLLRYPARRELYVQNGEQTYLYFLVAGKVQVNHYQPNGKLAVIAMMSPLAVIGDVEIFSFDKTITNVVTLEASVVLAIERPFVMRYGYEDARFLRFIISNLTSKLYATGQMQTGRVLPVIGQLALYLLRESEIKGDAIALPPKPHLAGLLGITPRHLNRVIAQLRDAQIVAVDGSLVTIIDRQRLEAFLY